MDRFPNLFTPLKVGGVEIRNRIFSTGHHTIIAHGDTVDDDLIAYHEARAKGGAGLIITEVNGIHETARYTTHLLMATEDRCIAGFRRLADALHGHGTKVFVQLFHPGREIMESQDGSIPVAYAPSVSPSERFHVIPRAMSRAMIAEIIAGYAAAAARVHAGGIDGVEIVASHGYLPAQFLNPQINRREDEYGGPFENRLRFLREVLDAVRASTSPDFVVGMRISGDEKDPEGLTEESSLQAIEALAGRLDYVNVIAGTSASLGGAIHIVPPMTIANAYVAPFAAAVKARVSIPVFVAGRINQPQEAEQVVASGQADMCGMTRAMICDPEMAGKAKAGALDDIRACIACNQACIGHFHRGYPISCIQHPETGRERTYGRMVPAEKRKSVLVVGGGPGGMKAAAVAAERGHEVTLVDKASRLGGQALLAQLLPGRAEFGGIVTNLSREVERAGVRVETNTEATRAMIDERRPDAVIVATGGTPLVPHGIEIAEGTQVANAWQVLTKDVNPGQSVLISDWRCDWIGPGLAELLAEAGCRVRLAVNGLHVGQTLPFYVRDSVAAQLNRLGVEVITYARLFGADETTAYLQHISSGEAILVEDVDTVVLAHGNTPVDDLLDGLVDYPGEVRGIGDCLASRTAEEAVLEGMKAAWAL